MAESSRATPYRIFISYRREDTAYPAGWLYDRLAERFGGGQVFKDVDSIDLGDDFAEVITAAVGSCDVLLALIGDRWLTITDPAGSRRIDNTNDFVRLEIEAALARTIRVVPILVGGARLPRAGDLPASLARLARLQALELSPNRFGADLGRLLKVLDNSRIVLHAAAPAPPTPVPVPPSRLARTLTGHTGIVSGVAFSPDGRLLATASYDETARLWDPATGRCLRTLTGHAGWVWGVAFSPDGWLLATAGGYGDKTARLWDPATGRCLRTLTGHTGKFGEVLGVAFSPDGRLLATAGGDETVRLWDPATGDRLRALFGHTRSFNGVAFSPDGRLLATACGVEETARVWDPATGDCLRTLTGHTDSVWDVAFSPDGRLLATASGDKTARLWN